MYHLCYLCLVFVMLSCLFIAALWSPAWKGLTSWLLYVMFNCVFVTSPCSILCQVWFSMVSIPDLCHLSYCCCDSRIGSPIIIVSKNVLENASEYKWLISALFLKDKDSWYRIMGGLLSRGNANMNIHSNDKNVHVLCQLCVSYAVFSYTGNRWRRSQLSACQVVPCEKVH